VIDGIDVSGLTLATNVFIPGNVLAGKSRAQIYIDERASQEQGEALISVFTGKQGGPIADLAALVGEVVKVERAPITFAVQEGKGTLRIGAPPRLRWSPIAGRAVSRPRWLTASFRQYPARPPMSQRLRHSG
jgi:hypothetical protein